MYELPVLSSAYGPVRWFIDGGMTRGIPEAAARARTITVYTDVGKVVDNLGLAGTDTIAVLIVEPSGRVLARASAARDDSGVINESSLDRRQVLSAGASLAAGLLRLG